MLQLLGFIIDCPDPMKLAAFYSQVTGRAIMEGSSDNFAGITFGEVDLAFQRVADYRPPRWPDDEHPQAVPPRLRSGRNRARTAPRRQARRDTAEGLHRTRGLRLAGLHRPGRASLLPVPPRRGHVDRQRGGVALTLIIHAADRRSVVARGASRMPWTRGSVTRPASDRQTMRTAQQGLWPRPPWHAGPGPRSGTECSAWWS